MLKLESLSELLADNTWSTRRSNFATLSILGKIIYINSIAMDKFFANYKQKKPLFYNLIKIKSVYYLLVSEKSQEGFYRNVVSDKARNIIWASGVMNLRKAMDIPTGSQRRFKIHKPIETDKPNIVAYKLTPFKEDRVESINL